MRTRASTALMLCSIGALTVHTAASTAGTAEIGWWVIGGGESPRSSGLVEMRATIGQPVIGPASSGPVYVSSGYWPRAIAAVATAASPTSTETRTTPPPPTSTGTPTPTPDGAPTAVPDKRIFLPALVQEHELRR